MKSKLILAAAVLVLSIGASQAGFFDLSVNDNAFDIWAGFNLGKNEEAQTVIGGRYLYVDDDDSSIPAFLFGFSSKPDGNEDVSFLLGAQAIFGESKNQDMEGVALGGSATWAPSKWKGVFVGGRIFWAPGVFCFGDTDGLTEWEVQGGYFFNPKMRIFLEYSNFSADVNNYGSVTVDSGTKLGFGAKF